MVLFQKKKKNKNISSFVPYSILTQNQIKKKHDTT